MADKARRLIYLERETHPLTGKVRAKSFTLANEGEGSALITGPEYEGAARVELVQACAELMPKRARWTAFNNGDLKQSLWNGYPVRTQAETPRVVKQDPPKNEAPKVQPARKNDLLESWHRTVVEMRERCKTSGYSTSIIISPRAVYEGVVLLKMGYSVEEVITARILRNATPEAYQAITGGKMNGPVWLGEGPAIKDRYSEYVESMDEPHHPRFVDLLRVSDWQDKATGKRLNPYLPGYPGTGKSTIVKQVAKALGLPFASLSCSPDKMIFDLVGFQRGPGEVVKTPFVDTWDFGGCFLLDEMDSSTGSIMTGMNEALANDFYAFPDGMRRKHLNTLFFAAANTMGDGPDETFVGRSTLDPATLDRFVFIRMDIDTDMEKRIGRLIVEGETAPSLLDRDRADDDAQGEEGANR